MLRDLDVIAIGSVTLQFFGRKLESLRTQQAPLDGSGDAHA
jgi:hypothetical protein